MQRDTAIFEIINKELERQQNGLELIASENFVSPQVMEAVGSVLTNKYAEGYPGKRYYGGCEFVDESETLAIERAQKLFGAEYVNVQPHSGAQANGAVYLSLLKPGDKIMGLDLAHGGHLTHGSPVSFSGQQYQTVHYGVEQETGTINYDNLVEIAVNERPKLIVAGASAYSRDWDYKRMREVADEIGALLMADIAHPAGIIAKGYLNDPLPHCHIVTTTTHKTLRGPRGGMIMMGSDFPNFMGLTTSNGKRKRMSTLINSGVFPGTQGGPLEHVIAGKAVAFGEALTDEYDTYIKQVLKNAQAMAKAFSEREYKIITGGTDNHLMLIDLHNKNITGKEAEDVLGKAHITINKNMVPFDDQPPMVTSGMRIGTSAITTRGMDEKAMEEIVDLIDIIITNKDRENIIQETATKVSLLAKRFPLYAGQ